MLMAFYYKITINIISEGLKMDHQDKTAGTMTLGQIYAAAENAFAQAPQRQVVAVEKALTPAQKAHICGVKAP